MLKKISKILTAFLIIVLSSSAIACTYRANGSVIQDVDLTFSYEDSSSETVNVDATLNFYKTFAPETCNHLLSIIKSNFYNDTSAVFTDDGKLLVLGGFTYSEGEYTEKIYSGDAVIGEFARGNSKFKDASAGSLVMLREPTTDKNLSKKNDTGKAMFAIVLEESSYITPNKYTVFGKVDEETVESLVEMRDALLKDSDGFIKERYLGDRDEETDLWVVENGKYKGGIEFYGNPTTNEFKDVNKVVIPEKDDDGEDNPLYTKLTKTIYLDVYALPTKQISLKNIKIK